jgi:hypothetical protein
VNLDDPVVLDLVERNVNAMLIAHGLANLQRDEAFAILDNPNIGFCRDWEDPQYPYYSRQWMPPIFDSWLRRLPRSHEFFFGRDGTSDVFFGGSGNVKYPPGATNLIGDSICVTHSDSVFRFRDLSGDPQEWKVVDPIPSMRCREYFLGCCEWVPNSHYRFRDRTVLFGIDLSNTEYMGLPRQTTSTSDGLQPQLRAMEKFYESIGSEFGLPWLQSVSSETG